MLAKNPVGLNVVTCRLRVGHRLTKLINAGEERRDRADGDAVGKIAILGLIERLCRDALQIRVMPAMSYRALTRSRLLNGK